MEADVVFLHEHIHRKQKCRSVTIKSRSYVLLFISCQLLLHTFLYFKNILCNSPRIFEIKKVWVDQRTFTLSINQGGWIHPCVMDCFGMLTTTEQNHRRREGLLEKNDMLIHVVIKEDTVCMI
jgi:hypothetical protein